MYALTRKIKVEISVGCGHMPQQIRYGRLVAFHMTNCTILHLVVAIGHNRTCICTARVTGLFFLAGPKD